MLLIVTYHIHAQALDKIHLLPVQTQIFFNVFGVWGRVGVNLFLMIGCYFMVDQKFRMSKILTLWSELWIYSVVFSFVTLCCNKGEFSFGFIKRAIFPFLSGQCWFFSIYIILILLSPFLNYLFKMERRMFTRFVLIGGGICIGFATITPRLMDNNLVNIMWFAFVYIFIGWYKNYKPTITLSTEICLLIIIVGMFVMPSIAMVWMNNSFLSYVNRWTTQWLNDFKSLPNFTLSLIIFRFFERLNIGSNKYINKIAAGCSGVYIIHQIHEFYMIIWNSIFVIPSWRESDYAILFFAMTVVAVFVFASLIDYVRSQTIGKLWVKCRLYNFLNVVGNELIVGDGDYDIKIFNFGRIYRNSQKRS